MHGRERLERTVNAIAANRYAAGLSVAGWLYAARFDHAFIDAELELRPIRRRVRPPLATCVEVEDLGRAAGAHLARLLAMPDVRSLHAALEELVQLDAPSLTRDDAVDPAVLFANGDALNVVVLGAGPIGLAMASAIRLALGPSANVLVVDNRVSSPHHKPPYERRWLTAIHHEKLAGIVEDPLRAIFATIGTRFIGATINVMETLLLLSCRRMGVRFLFAEQPDVSFVGELPVHLVVDATGNRLRAPAEPGVADAVAIGARVEAAAALEVSDEVLQSYGVDVGAPAPEPRIDVVSFGDLRFPHYREQRLKQAMLKLIQIPGGMCAPLVELVASRNHDNKFYVWRGSLRDEINEGLVIINLTRAEYEALCAAHEFPLGLAEAAASPQLRGVLDPRTVELLEFVVAGATESERARIVIDAPFLWRPYWVDEQVPARLHDKPLLRIGDSIYNGNVKLANGMGPHLQHVHFIQEMLWGHATAVHADVIARSMGLPR